MRERGRVLMRVFINAGFGSCIGYQSLQWLRGLGVAGVRQDVPWGAPAQYRERLIAEVGKLKLDAIWIIGGNMAYAEGGLGWLPDNYRPSTEELCKFARDFSMQLSCYPGHRWIIELGNEPNLERHGGPLYKDPEQFARWLHYVPAEIWSENPDIEIIAGGICGLHKRSLKYLKRVFDAYYFPRKVIVGFHPYRTDKSFSESKKEIEEAFAEFRQIVGDGRRFAVSEIGWHSAIQKTNGFLPCRRKEFRFTDQDVADFAERELAFWMSQGAEALCWFQLNDGTNEFNPEDCFGIRDKDGRRKPAANAIRRHLKGIANE
jgi:hypothetical protein